MILSSSLSPQSPPGRFTRARLRHNKLLLLYNALSPRKTVIHLTDKDDNKHFCFFDLPRAQIRFLSKPFSIFQRPCLPTENMDGWVYVNTRLYHIVFNLFE